MCYQDANLAWRLSPFCNTTQTMGGGVGGTSSSEHMVALPVLICLDTKYIMQVKLHTQHKSYPNIASSTCANALVPLKFQKVLQNLFMAGDRSHEDPNDIF